MANDSTVSHRCRETRKEVSADGWRFTDQFYVATEADLAVYELPYRSPTPWLSGKGPTMYTDPYVIQTTRVSFTPRDEAPWIVTVISAVRAYDVRIENGGRLEDQKTVSFIKKPYIMEPAWWGVRVASDADATARLLKYEILADGTLDPNDPPVAVACKTGQLILMNATSTSIGTEDLRRSEFAEADHPRIGYAGQRVSCTAAVVEFLTTDDPGEYVDFEGRNGDVPSAFHLPYDDTTGAWRVDDQKIIPTTFPQNGVLVKCHKVVRDLILTPFVADDSYWHPAKFPEWTWRNS